MDSSGDISSIITAINSLLPTGTSPTAPTGDVWEVARQLRRHLKNLQQVLQQSRVSITHDSRVIPCLQNLFTYNHTNSHAPLPSTSPQKYVPPAVHKHAQQISAPQSTPQTAASSDSETSDLESEDGTVNYGRIRFLALTCLQLLIKADSKALHPWWPSLLPGIDVMDDVIISDDTPFIKKTQTQSIATLGHVILFDSSARVRHAATVTLGQMLEGAAQRAYLAIGEVPPSLSGNRDHTSNASLVRGFLPLSITLGGLIMGMHAVLLSALLNFTVSSDPLLIPALLRTLCALIIGAPYHRLPSTLLPTVVESVRTILQQQQSAAQQDPTKTTTTTAAVVSGCLSCLAAALTTKFGINVSDSLAKNPIAIEQGHATTTPLMHYLNDTEHKDSHGQRMRADELCFEISSCIALYPSPSVQLEAIMALRGLVQTCSCVINDDLWTLVLQRVHDTTDKQLHNIEMDQNDARLGQQSILLAGDCVGRPPPGSTTTAARIETKVYNRWKELWKMSLRPIVKHRWAPNIHNTKINTHSNQTSLLQSAVFGAIAIAHPDTLHQIYRLSVSDSSCNSNCNTCLTNEMFDDACATLCPSLDEGGLAGSTCVTPSPVRAVAAKAMATLLRANMFKNIYELYNIVNKCTPALVQGCRDSVAAVRSQSAVTLVTATEMLLDHSSALRNTNTGMNSNSYERLTVEKQSQNDLETLLSVASDLAKDIDKIRPSGMNALGSLMSTAMILLNKAPDQYHLDQLKSGIECNDILKVQWSACIAAEKLLVASGFRGGQQGNEQQAYRGVVEALRHVVDISTNFRSRLLAQSALDKIPE